MVVLMEPLPGQINADNMNHDNILVMDGATGTNLFVRGMPQDVCIEEYLLSHPELIQTLQREFVDAGSELLIAPTFSANRHKLKPFGLADKVEEYNRRLVALTREVVDNAPHKVLVAGDMSPTGQFIKPYGDADFDDLLSIYAEQATALNAAGVDLFLIETMMSIAEARAAILACQPFNKPIYVTFTINERGHTLSGGTPICCLIATQELGINAFGLNCSFGPDSLAPYIRELVTAAHLPVIAKPNAGMPNPLLKHVYDLSPSIMAQEMRGLLDSGATIIGGCCGTTPEHIAAITEMVAQYKPDTTVNRAMQTNDILLANERQLFSLDNDRIDFSEMITCEPDMADLFMDIEDDSVDVIMLQIDTVDDAVMFAENAHLAQLPVCFHATSEAALDMALRLYQGRAMVDAHSPLDEPRLHAITKRYGAFLY